MRSAVLSLPKATAKHPAQRKRKALDCRYQQTSLFAVAAKLTVEPVPADLAIAPGRYHFVVKEGDRRWVFPVQWKESEVKRIFPRLQRLDWSLSEDEYYPVEISRIYRFVESLLCGEVAL